jgi:hypothetical protein
MNKPKVFISHISEETRLAQLIKMQVSTDFLGMLDVFVSSDQVSISVGSKWLAEVDEALKDAQIELVLCSRHSVNRPWINFEAGAGWVKGIPIVPICHTGMRPVDLPIPLNMLQGITASEEAGWQKVYHLLASKLGSAVPNANFSNLLNDIRTFEQDYGLLREVSAAIRALIKLLPDLEQIFRPNPVHRAANGDVGDLVLDKMRPHLDLLQAKGMLAYATGGNKMVFGTTGGGNVIQLNIEVKPAYYAVASRVELP